VNIQYVLNILTVGRRCKNVHGYYTYSYYCPLTVIASDVGVASV